MLGKSLDEAKKDVEKEFTINFDEDMNLLSDKDLKRRKELMDLQFQKNRVQLGDPDFIYDKQVCSNQYALLFCVRIWEQTWPLKTDYRYLTLFYIG